MTTIDMNNRKTGNVPSEADMLRERFLAGETTREDEARLYALLDRPGATAEELALMSIIRPPQTVMTRRHGSRRTKVRHTMRL